MKNGETRIEGFTEVELKVFVDATISCFEKMGKEPANVLDPMIVFGKPVFLDYTGLIQIYGVARGVVYLTAEREMAHAILESIGEEMRDERSCGDIVGELANIVASNAREVFGGQVRVDTPIRLDRSEEIPIVIPATTFALPILWRNTQASLVIGTEPP